MTKNTEVIKESKKTKLNPISLTLLITLTFISCKKDLNHISFRNKMNIGIKRTQIKAKIAKEFFIHGFAYILV